MSEKAIIYRRFSTDEQEGGNSLNDQWEACEAFARAKGWTIAETLDDEGYSAYKGEHLTAGKLGKLTKRIEAGELPHGTIILAGKLDRLSRRPVEEAMAWIYALTSKGVRIAIADSEMVYEANPDLGTFLATAVRFAQNHEESKKKSERIIAAKRALWAHAEAKTGKWTNLTPRVPSWLARTPARDGWIIDEDRAKLVRQIYEWCADGLGSQAIARRLNEAGVKAWGVYHKYDATWGITAVNQMLANPAVEGDYVGAAGIFKGQTLHGFFPRVVDADLVARARAAKLTRKPRGRRPADDVRGLFSGLTYCAECGHKSVVNSSTQKGRLYRYMRCEGHREGRGCTNNSYYAYERFENAAMDLCIDLALHDRFFASSGELQALRVEKAEQEKALADRQKARKRVLTLFETADDDDDQLAARLAELKAEIDAMKLQLVEIEAAIQKASGRVGAVEHLKRVNDIREASKSDDPLVREQARAKLRLAFAAIVKRVTVERIGDDKVFNLEFIENRLLVQYNANGSVRYVRVQSDDAVVEAGDPLVERLSALSAVYQTVV